jgi:ribosomal protein S18 acetylase RimI-like enzyme
LPRLTYAIRDARRTDLPAVRGLLTSTWHATYDQLYGADLVEGISRRWHSLATLSLQLDQTDTTFLVALDPDGGALATSLAAPAKAAADCVYLQRLYVLPQYQGQGIGRAVLRATLSRYPAARAVRLEVEPRNQRAIRFYEAEGFAAAGSIEHGNDETGRWTALLMQRRLPG